VSGGGGQGARGPHRTNTGAPTTGGANAHLKRHPKKEGSGAPGPQGNSRSAWGGGIAGGNNWATLAEKINEKGETRGGRAQALGTQ